MKLRRVVDWAQMSRRDTLSHLQLLHRRHGGVLFRKSPEPRAPYWVSVDALRVHWSSKFGEATAKGADLMAVYARLDRVEALAERALEAAIGGGRAASRKTHS